MKNKILFALFLGFIGLLGFSACTNVKAQPDTLPEVTVTGGNVKADGEAVMLPNGDFKVPLKLKLPQQAPFSVPQATGAPDDILVNVVFTSPQVGTNIGSWFKDNWVSWVAILMVVIQAVVNLTPTGADNSIFLLLKKLFDSVFPNRKTNGDVHP